MLWPDANSGVVWFGTMKGAKCLSNTLVEGVMAFQRLHVGPWAELRMLWWLSEPKGMLSCSPVGCVTCRSVFVTPGRCQTDEFVVLGCGGGGMPSFGQSLQGGSGGLERERERERERCGKRYGKRYVRVV